MSHIPACPRWSQVVTGRHRSSGIHCDICATSLPHHCHITGTWGARFCILLAFSLHLLPPATKTGTPEISLQSLQSTKMNSSSTTHSRYSIRIMSPVQWIINDNHPRYSSTFIPLGICWLSLGMKNLNIPVNHHGSWFLIDRLLG